MKATGLSELKVAIRESGMQDLAKALDGVVSEPLFSEEFANLRFPELTAAYTAKDSAATSDLSNKLKRVELIYAMALLRDAQYAYSGRKFMLALGEQDSFRLLYEGAKLFADASKPS